jgi:hypothetical protein
VENRQHQEGRHSACLLEFLLEVEEKRINDGYHRKVHR